MDKIQATFQQFWSFLQEVLNREQECSYVAAVKARRCFRLNKHKCRVNVLIPLREVADFFFRIDKRSVQDDSDTINASRLTGRNIAYSEAIRVLSRDAAEVAEMFECFGFWSGRDCLFCAKV